MERNTCKGPLACSKTCMEAYVAVHEEEYRIWDEMMLQNKAGP